MYSEAERGSDVCVAEATHSLLTFVSSQANDVLRLWKELRKRMVMVAQPCEWTYSYWNVHSKAAKMVNFITIKNKDDSKWPWVSLQEESRGSFGKYDFSSRPAGIASHLWCYLGTFLNCLAFPMLICVKQREGGMLQWDQLKLWLCLDVQPLYFAWDWGIPRTWDLQCQIHDEFRETMMSLF